MIIINNVHGGVSANGIGIRDDGCFGRDAQLQYVSNNLLIIRVWARARIIIFQFLLQ